MKVDLLLSTSPTDVEYCTDVLCNSCRCPETMSKHKNSAEKGKTFHLYLPNTWKHRSIEHN